MTAAIEIELHVLETLGGGIYRSFASFTRVRLGTRVPQILTAINCCNRVPTHEFDKKYEVVRFRFSIDEEKGISISPSDAEELHTLQE